MKTTYGILALAVHTRRPMHTKSWSVLLNDDSTISVAGVEITVFGGPKGTNVSMKSRNHSRIIKKQVGETCKIGLVSVRVVRTKAFRTILEITHPKNRPVTTH